MYYGIADLVSSDEVHRAGKRIDLRQREFALLEYLMRNAERTLSRTMLMEHIWDFHFDP